MTKLIGLRLSLAVDDCVDLKDVKPILAKMVSEHGTEEITTHTDEKGRIHWGTAEVLQGPEKVAPRKQPAPKRPNGAQQPDLPGSPG